MNAHFKNKLIGSGLIEKHNNFNARFTRDSSQEKAYNYVYLMTGYFPNFCEPLVKIGISNDPVRRLYGDGSGLVNYISAGCAFPIFVDFAFETVFARDIERTLHHLNDKDRVFNPDVFNGKTEWFIGLSIPDLEKEVISIYESIRSRLKLGKGKPVYETETEDYQHRFNVDTWALYDWFFENSHVSSSINQYATFARIHEMKKKHDSTLIASL